MYISFPSLSVVFSARYGITYLPILADLSAYAVFSRVMTSAKAQMAGLVAGVGVAYVFASRTTTLMGLTGVALYLVYKVCVHAYLYHMSTYQHVFIEDLEESFEKLGNKFVVTSEKVLDRKDPEFNTKTEALSNELHLQTEPLKKQWEDPAIIHETQVLLTDCQTFLFKIYRDLEAKTEHLKSNPQACLNKMVELVNSDPNEKFSRAFFILSRAYYAIRYKRCFIRLPNLQNSEEATKTGSTNTVKECELFISGSGPHREMNKFSMPPKIS